MLTVKINIASNRYDCNKCIIELSNKLPGSDQYRVVGSWQIKDLFLPYINQNRCEIKWDPDQGYING